MGQRREEIRMGAIPEPKGVSFSGTVGVVLDKEQLILDYFGSLIHHLDEFCDRVDAICAERGKNWRKRDE